MKIKRLSAIGSALVLSIASLLTIAFPQIAHAAAPYTCTWTGAGSDSNFSTADNWSNCNSAAPVATDDDDLVFDVTDLSSDQTLNNDISGLTVDSITFQGTNSSYYNYKITGDAITINSAINDNSSNFNDLDVNITLGGDVTITDSSSGAGVTIGDNDLTNSTTLNTNDNSLTITGSMSASCDYEEIVSSLSGSGSFTDSLSAPVTLLTDSPSYTGAVDITAGELGDASANGLGSASGVTVGSDATLDLEMSQSTTYSFPITLAGGTLATAGQEYTLGACHGGGGPTQSTATLSGSLALTANSTYDGGVDTDTTVTGTYTPGSYTLTAAGGSNGTLTLPGGSQVTPPASTTNYNSSSPSTDITVTENQTAVVDGSYGDTTVDSGGILEGNGTVAGLDVDSGGTVSPGQNCMTVNGDLNEGGTYNVEIGGTTACSGYTQLAVTSGNTVTLNNGNSTPTEGKLGVSLVNGFTPKAGETFEIINNQGGQAVSDTFSGLPEGSEITVSGYVFKITYVGGDPNNVELTVVSVPKTPDTGFGLTSYDVGLPLLGTALLAGGTYLISRRFNQPTNKKI